MANKERSALGRGLNSIFGSNVEKVLDDIQNNELDAPGRREIEIPVSQIRANPYQPRKEFDEKALRELAESIKVHGIFTPVLVRQSIRGYELIAGERRLRAAKIAGLKNIPAIAVDFTDEDMMEISLLENIQRENLNPIEEAAAYEALIRRLGYTQEKLAERVGKSREYCANMLRLLKLPQPVQEMVTARKLTMGHVRPLLALEDEDDIIFAAEMIHKDKMSVREVERYVKEFSGDKKKTNKNSKRTDKDPLIHDLENRISRKLGTQVTINGRKFIIDFTDTSDLNRILDILGLIED